MSDKPPYWFPVKRYGWGWGLPITWQGWVVLAIFVGLLIAGALWLLPSYGKPAFVVYVLLLVAAFTFVCWLKGEPPGWHWGSK
ncbi:DUF4175 domain-containing protein [Ramlibacter sp. G-1-2-2]|uniref:DUF4175 domain-containing protein n=1 Tax=Ramlibacter agri TaxID=2728837 RepID=A0A848H949_9BURK|nr:hypothetical protein [Ramlibacter agri]NML44178.1 DUF4175 domain-containing protein [Ramlibacter agri]